MSLESIDLKASFLLVYHESSYQKPKQKRFVIIIYLFSEHRNMSNSIFADGINKYDESIWSVSFFVFIEYFLLKNPN